MYSLLRLRAVERVAAASLLPTSNSNVWGEIRSLSTAAGASAGRRKRPRSDGARASDRSAAVTPFVAMQSSAAIHGPGSATSASTQAPAAAPTPHGGLPPAAAPVDGPRTGPIGYQPWKAGQVRRFSWPLFGLEAVPPCVQDHAPLSFRIFGCGAKYLGDEIDMLGPEAREPTWKEVAIVGRSNAGKSTLLNTLLGSKDNTFVPVSKHPGSTTHLDFYGVGTSTPPQFVVVDTPGYGFTSKGKKAGSAWSDKIRSYLVHRDPMVLGRTLVLLDVRVGITPIDVEVMDVLEEGCVPWHVVLTKADTVSEGEVEHQVTLTALALAKRQLVFPIVNAVSSRTGEGVAELQRSIIQSAKLHHLGALARRAVSVGGFMPRPKQQQ